MVQGKIKMSRQEHGHRDAINVVRRHGIRCTENLPVEFVRSGKGSIGLTGVKETQRSSYSRADRVKIVRIPPIADERENCNPHVRFHTVPLFIEIWMWYRVRTN